LFFVLQNEGRSRSPRRVNPAATLPINLLLRLHPLLKLFQRSNVKLASTRWLPEDADWLDTEHANFLEPLPSLHDVMVVVVWL